MPHDGHARAGEVGLRRSTDEPAEQWKVTSCGGRGGKGAAGGEHRWGTHAPDPSRNQHVPVFGDVRRANCNLACLTPSSFRGAVCVDAHVRICAGGGS